MGERRGVYRVLIGKTLRERDHLEDAGIDGRIILRWGLQEVGCRAWTGLIGLRNRGIWRALVKAVMNILVP
jgi:hypothetical protein